MTAQEYRSKVKAGSIDMITRNDNDKSEETTIRAELLHVGKKRRHSLLATDSWNPNKKIP